MYSKIATILLICITCIGTRNKKHLEFNARKQVIFPLTGGLLLLVLSVWLFGHPMGNTALYAAAEPYPIHGSFARGSDTGVHIALDNISKFIKRA